MDAKIPTHEWGTYDLNRDVEREAIKKNGAQVEHIDHPGAPEKVV